MSIRHHIRYNKTLDEIKEIHAQGASLDERDNLQQTLLHQAVSFHRMDVVKWLLDMGHEINATNRWQSTPLHIAASYQNREMIQYLRSRGAKDLPDRDGVYPVHSAAKYDSEHIMDLFVDTINVRGIYGETPLIKSINGTVYDCAKQMIRMGAKLNIPNQNGQTALHIAVFHGEFDLVQMLVEWGADPNVLDDEQLNSAELPYTRYHYTIAKLLIEMGTKEMIIDDTGPRPFRHLAKYAHLYRRSALLVLVE